MAGLDAAPMGAVFCILGSLEVCSRESALHRVSFSWQRARRDGAQDASRQLDESEHDFVISCSQEVSRLLGRSRRMSIDAEPDGDAGAESPTRQRLSGSPVGKSWVSPVSHRHPSQGGETTSLFRLPAHKGPKLRLSSASADGDSESARKRRKRTAQSLQQLLDKVGLHAIASSSALRADFCACWLSPLSARPSHTRNRGPFEF